MLARCNNDCMTIGNLCNVHLSRDTLVTVKGNVPHLLYTILSGCSLLELTRDQYNIISLLIHIKLPARSSVWVYTEYIYH